MGLIDSANGIGQAHIKKYVLTLAIFIKEMAIAILNINDDLRHNIPDIDDINTA